MRRIPSVTELAEVDAVANVRLTQALSDAAAAALVFARARELQARGLPETLAMFYAIREHRGQSASGSARGDG